VLVVPKSFRFTYLYLFERSEENLLAFPGGEGGPLAVDEEIIVCTKEIAIFSSASFLGTFSAEEGFFSS